VGPLGWKHPGTSREEQAPKGESHERRPHETRRAGNRRAQSVERVIKPWGRNPAGRLGPAANGPSIPCVLKGTKAHERSRPRTKGRLGFAGRSPRRRCNSTGGCAEGLDLFGRVRRQEDRTAEGQTQRQSGSVEPIETLRRRANTPNEALIREGTGRSWEHDRPSGEGRRL
jgi:hypothetical protein